METLTKMLEQMAYEVADCIEEAEGYVDEIKDRWNRDEEIRKSLIDVCMDDLSQAYHKAKTIEIAMQNLNKYLETVGEVLNDRNY